MKRILFVLLIVNIVIYVSAKKVNADYPPPPSIITSPSHPLQSEWYSETTVDFTWNQSTDTAVIGYFFKVDKDSSTVPAPSDKYVTQLSTQILNVSEGTDYFHIASSTDVTTAGIQANHYRLKIDTTPPESTTLQAEPKESGAIYLDWDSVSDITSCVSYYKIYRSSTTGTGHSLTDTTSLTEYTDSGVELLNQITYYYKIHAVDNAENEQSNGNTEKSAVCLKIADPPINLTAIPQSNQSEWYNVDYSSFNWSPSTSWTTGYYYMLDQNPSTVPTESINMNGLFYSTTVYFDSSIINNDGIWYFHIVSKDIAGNVGAVANHFSIKVKVSSPASPSVINSQTHPDQNTWYNTTIGSFTWAEPVDISGISGYYISVDTQPSSIPEKISENYTTAESTTISISEGTKYFHIISRDNAGNVSNSAAHYRVKIDTTPPEPTTLQAEPKESGAIYLDWDGVNDITSGVSYYKIYRSSTTGTGHSLTDTTSLTEYTDSGVELLNQITYYYKIHAVDNAEKEQSNGNTEKSAVCLKTADPPINLTATPQSNQSEWYNVDYSSFNWSPPTSWTTGYYYMLDQNPSTVPTESINMGGLFYSTTVYFDSSIINNDGMWYFHIVSKDIAGNVGTVANHFSIKVKVSSPASPSVINSQTHPDQNTWYNTTVGSFTWAEPVDISGISGYYISVDAQPSSIPEEISENYTTAESTTISISEGTKYFHIISRDNAGNVSNTATHYRVKIDTTPPEATTTLQAESKESGAIYLDWDSVNDITSGVSYYKIYRTSDTFSATPTDTTSLLEYTDTGAELVSQTTYYYKIHAVDNTGNEQLSGNTSAQAVCLKSVSPPTVTSISHPDQEEWYNINQAAFSWTPLSAATTGYYFILDKNAATIPTTGSPYTVSLSTYFSDLTDGIWYFHIIAKDIAGNISYNATHYTVKIKVTLPEPPPIIISPTHPIQISYYTENDPAFSWTSPDDIAGIEGYLYLIDNSSSSIPALVNSTFTTKTNVSFTGIPPDVWHFHIVSKDNAGNIGTTQNIYSVMIAGSGLPTVSAVNPDFGYTTSFTTITISGNNFTGVTSIKLDDISNTELINIELISINSVIATVPPNVTTGEYNVILTNNNGSNKTSLTKFKVLLNPTISGEARCVHDPLTYIEIPAGTFNVPAVVKISTAPVNSDLLDDANRNVTSASIIQLLDVLSNTVREITVTDDEGDEINMAAGRAVFLTMHFSGIENSEIESRLRIFYIDDIKKEWVLAPGTQSVDTKTKTVTTQIDHFSIFRIGVLQSTSKDLRNVIVYPSPFNPKTSLRSTLKFINLTDNPTIKIYNFAGELVIKIPPGASRNNTVNPGNNGRAEWDGTNNSGYAVARGTYFYIITDSAGNKCTGKFGLIK